MKGAVQGAATRAASPPVAKAPARPVAGPAPPQPHDPGAQGQGTRQTQPQRQKQVGHEGDEGRILQLEAPTDRLPPGPQPQQQGSNDAKEGQDAAGIGQGMLESLPPARPALPRQAEGLHGEDGEDAGHEVEDQPPGQGQQQGHGQAKVITVHARLRSRLRYRLGPRG